MGQCIAQTLDQSWTMLRKKNPAQIWLQSVGKMHSKNTFGKCDCAHNGESQPETCWNHWKWIRWAFGSWDSYSATKIMQNPASKSEFDAHSLLHVSETAFSLETALEGRVLCTHPCAGALQVSTWRPMSRDCIGAECPSNPSVCRRTAGLRLTS